MDRFKAMSVFIAVAEEQGFAAASRRLSMSPPAVTRVIAELENRLGVNLLIRTTRKVRLTDAGHQYLLDARRILADVDCAEESAAGIHGDPTGQLVVTAPVMFGRLYVTPVITAYLEEYEQVTVSAIFVDRITNMIAEGIDVGIRIGTLPDSNLRAISLGYVKMKTYASPNYLARYGTPKSPQCLLEHRLIATSAGDWHSTWPFIERGKQIQLKVAAAFSTTTNDSAIAAAVQGYGITRVLSYQAAPMIADGTLIPVLENHEGEALPVSIVHPQGRNMPAKVRAFIDKAVNDISLD
ncbi:MAG: LysR family transcriptional regulator [Pseudomonadales bacterium]|nr:LysR family transcriptional regulator [Pseudomonadales bacterium]